MLHAEKRFSACNIEKPGEAWEQGYMWVSTCGTCGYSQYVNVR